MKASKSTPCTVKGPWERFLIFIFDVLNDQEIFISDPVLE